MKPLFFFAIILLLVSCQYFEREIPSEADLLQQRLEAIDWSEVSSYPSLSVCESLYDRERKKECFFDHLSGMIQERLSVDTLVAAYAERDTLWVYVTIKPDSSVLFEARYEPDSTYDKEETDRLLQKKLADFPAIEPAQKEGIPVTTRFLLPVVLKMEQ